MTGERTTGEREPGREGAIAAIVAAATELFTEQGPAATSLRDVARRAGVNHGLIHHYIGSRDDLLHLVFATVSERARAGVVQADDPVEALRALRRQGAGRDGYARLLAWAILEGRDPAAFHGRSPALDAVVDAGGSDSRELRVAVAMAMVQSLGWKLFGDYVRVAVGLDDADELRAELERMVDGIVAGSVANR